MVYQYFVHNLNFQINQVSESSNLLVPMPHAPSGPQPIITFVCKYARTSGQSFGRQGNSQKRSDNSIYSVSTNGRPYNGPVYDNRKNILFWLLWQMLLILFLAVVQHSSKRGGRPTRIIASLRLVIASICHHSKSTYFRHPYLSEE